MEVTSRVLDRLIVAAKSAARRAYCPYSHFPVGAAVLTEKGEIVIGCNVENASYGLTICAERSAIFKAVSEFGAHAILAVVVYTPTNEATPPCGACRQVINEFGPEALIVSVCDLKIGNRCRLGKLLPGAFGPHNLAG